MERDGKDRKLLTAIINELTNNSEKTVNEITESLNSNWTSVQKYLESMVASGLAKKREAGNRTYYKLKEDTKFRQDTYFGLPIGEEQIELLKNLYSYIIAQWKIKKGKTPTQMELYKTAHDINKDCNLKLPFGWYIYGAIPVLTATSEIPEAFNLSNEITTCADKVIQKYLHNTYAWQTKMQQYRQEKKELYLKKEQILAKLYKKEFNQQLYSDLDLLFITASELTRNKLDSKIFDSYPVILEDYVKQYFLPNKEKEEVYEIKEEIDNSFKQIWELIAMHNFKKDMEAYYDKSILEDHIGIHINEQRKIVLNLLEDMASKLTYAEPTSKEAIELKNIKEEIHKKAKENKSVEKMEKCQEELFKATGIKTQKDEELE